MICWDGYYINSSCTQEGMSAADVTSVSDHPEVLREIQLMTPQDTAVTEELEVSVL